MPFVQRLSDILRETAENDGKVNFVAVAQILQVPAEVESKNKVTNFDASIRIAYFNATRECL